MFGKDSETLCYKLAFMYPVLEEKRDYSYENSQLRYLSYFYPLVSILLFKIFHVFAVFHTICIMTNIRIDEVPTFF